MSEWRATTLGEVMTLDISAVEVNATESYEIVGVLNRGRGLLHRDPIRGSDTAVDSSGPADSTRSHSRWVLSLYSYRITRCVLLPTALVARSPTRLSSREGRNPVQTLR